MNNTSFAVRAGFVGFGEVNTPREFIDPRCREAADALRKRGIEVFETAPVSDDPAGAQADRAAAELAKFDFDALVVCVAGWIPSWAVLRTIDAFRNKPILLWGLSGWRTDDHFVTTADQAGSTALRAPFAEMGLTFKYLVNFKDSRPRYDEAADFLRAASAAAALRRSRIGMAGYRDMNLYGTLYDGTSLRGTLGTEIEHFDLLEIAEILKEIPASEIEAAAAKIRKEWNFLRDPQPGTLENSASLALAFQRKIRERGYDGFSFCDVDGVKKLLKFAPAGALTLLHELMPLLVTVPENDSHGAVTLLLVQYLTGGKVPAYMEFYEFTANSALMGVPDYVPGAVVDGKITVMPNAFGSFGEGLLNVSKVRTGVVTLVRLFRSGAGYGLHAVTAEAVTPEKWEEAGWAPPAPQLPSLEMKFAFSSDRFLEQVQGQHYIVAYGDITNRLRDFCAVTGLDFID